jgi:hypothetical protein
VLHKYVSGGFKDISANKALQQTSYNAMLCGHTTSAGNTTK